MKTYKLGMLGVGKMGGSILSGIIKQQIFLKEDILLYDVNEDIQKEYSNNGYTFSKNEKELIKKSEIIILAIKPQMFKTLKELNFDINNKVIVSIAAGKTFEDLKEIFGEQKYIRVMPNTPALISCGASAISKSDNVTEEEFNKIKNIFSSIGVVEEIDEKLMNEIIPINGSMPAFLYYFVLAFIKEGVKNGLDYEVCKKLACNAIIGSSKIILESDKEISQLINDVCSPGGTTLAGLKVFEEYNLNDIISKTSYECVKRAYELSNIK